MTVIMQLLWVICHYIDVFFSGPSSELITGMTPVDSSSALCFFWTADRGLTSIAAWWDVLSINCAKTTFELTLWTGYAKYIFWVKSCCWKRLGLVEGDQCCDAAAAKLFLIQVQNIQGRTVHLTYTNAVERLADFIWLQNVYIHWAAKGGLGVKE